MNALVSTLAVELSAVCKSFGRTEIIRGVDLAIPRGERHAIIGPNGAGKTTLFNMISGRFPVTSGTIAVNGRSIWPNAIAIAQPACVAIRAAASLVRIPPDE